MNPLLWSVLIGLSAYRGFRVLALDSIAESLRDWLEERRQQPWRFLDDLLTCPWCIGWWYCGIGAWIVTAQQDYSLLTGGMIWCAASTVCGSVHTTLERMQR